jgi:hypothetical protein
MFPPMNRCAIEDPPHLAQTANVNDDISLRNSGSQPSMVSAPGWLGVATSSNIWSSLTC